MDGPERATSWMSRNWTKIRIVLGVTAIKMLLIPSYRSTDFEVHRNWMAITNSLPMKEWYTNTTSEWTLDYPPLFAWFEWALAKVARLVDPDMLQVGNLNYASDSTVLFMRGSVIASDLVLATGAMLCTRRLSKVHSDVVFFLILANPGLLIVDHVHFQYNGFLLGVLLWSLGSTIEGYNLVAAILFAVLVNLKHLFAVLGPVYAVYLLRNHCRAPRAMQKFFQLFSAVLIVCGLSFGPFIEMGQLSQVLKRLFPFGRSLCHAYWAPNAWALYTALDKALIIMLKWANVPIETQHAMSTGGLVGGTKFMLLPQIPPWATVLLILISIAPVLYGVWRNPNPIVFIKAVTFTALTSFVLGYHVHEKASLVATVPAALSAVGNPRSAGVYMFLVITATYGLFPLLFTPAEYLIKVFLLLTYSIVGIILLRGSDDFAPDGNSELRSEQANSMKDEKSERKPDARGEGSPKPTRSNLNADNDGQFQTFWFTSEICYLLGLVVVEFYASFLHFWIFKETLPFLPLMLVSVYSAGGIVWCWSQPDIIEVVLIKQD